MDKVFATAILAALAAGALIAIGAIVAVVPTWLLWNWLMPSIFHVREITFWETLGLLFLSGFLLKSSGSSSSSSKKD